MSSKLIWPKRGLGLWRGCDFKFNNERKLKNHVLKKHVKMGFYRFLNSFMNLKSRKYKEVSMKQPKFEQN